MMPTRVTQGLWIGGLVLALGGPLFGIASYERQLVRSEPVLLELAPVDPRSLIQGDYMTLRYALARDLGHDMDEWPQDGLLAVIVDERGVVTGGRRLTGALEPGERRLRYRIRGGRMRIASEAWFFEEGTASVFEASEYGELMVDPEGRALLVGIRDEALRRLEPGSSVDPAPIEEQRDGIEGG